MRDAKSDILVSKWEMDVDMMGILGGWWQEWDVFKNLDFLVGDSAFLKITN